MQQMTASVMLPTGRTVIDSAGSGSNRDPTRQEGMMKEAKYYEITVSEDGDMSVIELNTDELNEALDEEFGDKTDDNPYADCIPDPDPMYWNGARLLIRGEIVVPVAEVIVKKMRVPQNR